MFEKDIMHDKNRVYILQLKSCLNSKRKIKNGIDYINEAKVIRPHK